MREKKVTFNDIAEYTGFSKTTISRYFNNPESLTLESQERIKDALSALNYKENKVARSFANGKTEFIGIIVPNLYMHFYSEILNQLLSSYERFGYKFLVFLGHHRTEMEQKCISELLAYQVEGMIILSQTICSKDLASYGIPVVAIEREDEYICSVNTDNYAGGVQAAELLLKGSSEILFHTNSLIPPSVPAYGRIKGFRDTCEQRGIPHEIIQMDWGATYEETVEKSAAVIDEIDRKYPHQRKGLFISNDTHANIFLNVLFKKYGRFPEQYQLVGFDNSYISREAIIPISTVGQQTDQMVDEAMQLLILQMNERKKRRPAPLKEPIHKMIPPILVPRDTTLNT